MQKTIYIDLSKSNMSFEEMKKIFDEIDPKKPNDCFKQLSKKIKQEVKNEVRNK